MRQSSIVNRLHTLLLCSMQVNCDV